MALIEINPRSSRRDFSCRGRRDLAKALAREAAAADRIGECPRRVLALFQCKS